MNLREALARANRAQQAINDMGFGPPPKRHELPKLDAPQESFAVALRRVREEIGLSQSRLAARAGYDCSYVSRLEGDSRAPTRDAVLNLASAMGLGDSNRDYLLAAAGFMPEDATYLLASEPVVVEAFTALTDDSLPDDVRDDLRAAIRMALRQAQRASGEWVMS